MIQKVPVRELKRVATAGEFEAALRRMVADTRSHGAAVLNLLEASCLDHRALDDPMRTLYARAPEWHVVYPDDPVVRRLLQQGAQAYVETRNAEAQQYFESAITMQPDLPLARYDLGVAKLAPGAGARGSGRRHHAVLPGARRRVPLP